MYAPREIAARLFIDHGGARARDGKSFPRRSIRGSVYSRYINAQFRASANSIGVEKEIPSKELAKITAHFRIVHGSTRRYIFGAKPDLSLGITYRNNTLCFLSA